MQTMKTVALLWATILLAGAVAHAQTRPAGVEEDSVEQHLGEHFFSRTAGIAFRPPRNATQVKPPVVGTNIVQYVNADEKWALRVSQMIFDAPEPLIGRDNPATPLVDETKNHPGVLPQMAQQLLIQNPGGKLLRQDVINIGRHDAGLVILRFAQGSQTYLRQTAVIQRNDQHYYVLELTTPSWRNMTDADEREEYSEAMAVRLFNAILDSVQLLDLRLIEADIRQRLYSTRALLVNLAARTRQVLAAEQYFRILRNGKDVGWSFVAEELGQRLGKDGVFVAISTHGQSPDGSRADVAMEMFCEDSRASEAWVSITVVEKDGKKEQSSEFGQSERRTVPRLVGGAGDKDKGDIRAVEQRTLRVTQTNKAGASTVTRELAVHYLPQALGHLLPRLVPTDRAKGYLFLVWVGGERELIQRYVDVEPEKPVRFAGREVRAAVVKDRLGLEGEPTFHYLAGGKYLGSESPASGISLVATDAQTIQQLWPGAKATRPHILDTPGDQLGK